MKSCAMCGGDLTGRKNFCGHCGARIGAEESAASEELICRARCSNTKRPFLVWFKREGKGIWRSQKAYQETFVRELGCGLFDFDFITEISQALGKARCGAFVIQAQKVDGTKFLIGHRVAD
jgi:hypothetical protein